MTRNQNIKRSELQDHILTKCLVDKRSKLRKNIYIIRDQIEKRPDIDKR